MDAVSRIGEAVMHVILWEFRVAADRQAAFEEAYGPTGAWARLFAEGAGFIGVELLRCTNEAGRYVTVDRWRSRADFDAFKRRFGAAYEALNRELEHLKSSEARIGAFE
jgi:heme-degrading monooxygenase HmoA